MSPTKQQAFFPGRPQIDAYGDGGFRFAGMSHRGSILVRADGVCGWQVSDVAGLTCEAFAAVVDGTAVREFVLLGTGKTLVWPRPEVRKICTDREITLECMDTGAAVRTYNILLNEGRVMVAALIAVPGP